VQTHGERRSADNQPVSKGEAKGLLRMKTASVSKDGEFQIEPYAIALQLPRGSESPLSMPWVSYSSFRALM
jgi:hypothetical protein